MVKQIRPIVTGIILGVCLLLPAAASAQVSTAGVIFLTIEPGARNAGMGGAGVGLGGASGGTASFYNPAALGLMEGTTLTGMHNKALPELVDDFYYEFLGGTHSLGPAGGIGGNITFYNYGSQTRTDGAGNDLGEIVSFDMATSVSYGLALSSRSALGGTFKIIYSNLANQGAEAEQGDGRAFTFAVDAGFMLTGVLPHVDLGVVLQNIGPDIAYIDRDQASPLPANLRVGMAWQVLDLPRHRLIAVFDVYKMLAQTEHSWLSSLFTGWLDDPLKEEWRQMVRMGGVEYTFDDLLSLRLGYFNDTVGRVYYPTFGAGFAYQHYRFDLSHAYAPDKPYAQGSRVSFSLVF